MKQPITIGAFNFESKKKAEIFVKEKINQIGYTDDLKKFNLLEFNFFLNLFQLHIDADEKIKNLKTIRIYKNIGGTALVIVNKDNTHTEISWRKCITRNKLTNEALFKRALRATIQPQIDEFRQNNNHIKICELCNCNLENKITHIDHIFHFHKMVDIFIKEKNIEIPKNYSKCQMTYKTIFHKNDILLQEKFFKFHLENSKLRKICCNCNIDRPN